MISKWSEAEEQRFVERYSGCRRDPELARDLALRVYASRLIGADGALVLHGGGNTSVKSTHTSLLGEPVPAIYVKGSGWDLKTIEPAGFPGLDLEYLRRLRPVESLSDEAMVNELRTHMFDASGPTPSVETLLHAFVDEKFVDHSHADAIVALTNNVDADVFVAECFGDELIVVPYVMPGFVLSKVAGDLYAASPGKRGMLLLNHGLFTWGATARESYEKHIELVDRAQRYLDSRKKTRAFAVSSPPSRDPIEVLPLLRGAIALHDARGRIERRFVLTVRNTDAISQFLNGPELLRAAATGPLTPDHIIRTKELPLVVELAENDATIVAKSVQKAVSAYAAAYDAYFESCSAARGVTVSKLDPLPRIVLIPGIGLIAAGETIEAANVAADIYEHTIAVKTLVSPISIYRGLPQLDLFDVEYWSLEQAKLGGRRPKPLEGQVAVITGGAGAIGLGIGRVLKQAGAEVVLTDLRGASEAAKALGCVGLEHDVTSTESTRTIFREVCLRFGGVDIVVPNAGVALSAPIENLSDADAHRVMGVNFHGYLNAIQEGARIMKRQATGGNIVIISSKNVLAPGAEFGVYSASKAAGHQLGKVAALELAEYGIRVNMVTPDAVFCSESDPPGTIRSGLWQEIGPDRANAHKIPPEELEAFYRDRNLLKIAVSAEDVGRAVLFFATNQTPTTGVTLPVDGGVPGAFPR